MKKILTISSIALLLAVFVSACAHRDCRGNKHRVKTNMGGYL